MVAVAHEHVTAIEEGLFQWPSPSSSGTWWISSMLPLTWRLKLWPRVLEDFPCEHEQDRGLATSNCHVS